MKRGADVLALRLRQRFSFERVIGPDTPPLYRVNDLYHLQLLLKFERNINPEEYKAVLQIDLEDFSVDYRWKRLRVKVDVDPI